MKRYLLISPVTANKPLFLRKNPSKEQGEVYRKETVKLTPVNAYDIRGMLPHIGDIVALRLLTQTRPRRRTVGCGGARE
jgi:hypothetical protein